MVSRYSPLSQQTNELNKESKMISVKLAETIKEMKFQLKDLTYENYTSSRNAFIGTVNNGDVSLYLVSFSRIIKANNFNNTWAHPETEVTVKEWVDVTITVDQ
jgi:hypothetical protein